VPVDRSTAWVEDVGSVQLEATWYDAPAPPGDWDAAPVPSSEAQPAPASDQSPQPASEARPPAKLITHVVQAGDTLSKLAARFEVTTETLIWANELANPDMLLTGSKVLIPPMAGVLHRVRPGDTVNELSKYYQTDLQKVIEVNDLQSPYTIMVGQRLLLPDGKLPPPPEQTGDSAPKPSQENDVQSPRDGTALANLTVPAAVARQLPRPPGATPEQARFILSAAEAARESKRATGIPASVTIAQAILESFWGGSRLSRENHNYFGIKAKEQPGTAGVVWYDTWEVLGGANVVVRAPFRAYNTMADSFVDHGRFFHQNPRYAAALAARDDPKEFARAINRAGYATDPAYSAKLIGFMDRFNLYAYDEAS
jgi:flagellum-specific peptidoglycan hydrolase FlgJ